VEKRRQLPASVAVRLAIEREQRLLRQHREDPSVGGAR
jgi:hypothetical protein